MEFTADLFTFISAYSIENMKIDGQMNEICISEHISLIFTEDGSW